MSRLSELINEIIYMNSNDDIAISKKKFYNNSVLKGIINDYKFNNKSKNKLYQFAIFVARFENKRLRKKVTIVSDKKYDNVFFDNIQNVRINNIRYFSALFLQHLLFNRVSFDELKMFCEVLGRISESYFTFIWSHKSGKRRLFNSKYGAILHENGLATPAFAIGDLEYELNGAGHKFFDNIFIDFSKKEKKIYSTIIDLKKLSQFMTAEEHRKNYTQIFEKIKASERCIELARIHEGDFKVFFEEYDVLIRYALIKYGNDCQIRFCGKETKGRLKYDGIIKDGNLEEKTEITYPFFNEEETEHMKHLNNYGMTDVKVVDFDGYMDSIVDIIKDRIEYKNSLNSYDSSITLLVMVDVNDLVINIDEEEIKKINKRLEDIKTSDFVFGSVYVLVNRYVNEEYKPWLIKVK